ncbi:MAG: hypothetical protein ABFS32_14810 [Bacteroidota bacterium]
MESDSVYRLTGIDPDSSELNYGLKFEKPDSTNEFLTEENIETFMRLKDNYDLSIDQVMDSLNTTSLSSFQYNLTRQYVRLARADKQIVLGQLLKNLPIMMLFTMPLFALLLKLFYMRRHQYYITHLIHALHLHSFAYVIYGFAFVMARYWVPDGTGFYVILSAVILASTHSYISFLKVYKQGWFKTLVKFKTLGFLYSWLLFFAFIVELVFSVATF